MHSKSSESISRSQRSGRRGTNIGGPTWNSGGSCTAIPLDDGSVDVVVSFETIEHHDAHVAMLSEFKRVLKPGGVLVISSPDKVQYSDKPGYHNRFHVKELLREEFQALLEGRFRNVRLLGQRVLFGSVILSERDKVAAKRYVMMDEGKPSNGAGFDPIYWIGLASDKSCLRQLRECWTANSYWRMPRRIWGAIARLPGLSAL